MFKRVIISLLILVSTIESCAQSLNDFKINIIDKRVGYFQLDTINLSSNLSSPLDYYLSRAQVCLSGKYRNWSAISTSMFDFSADVPDKAVDDRYRNYVLNENIDFIVSYRDSVASIVTHNDGEDYVLVNN